MLASKLAFISILEKKKAVEFFLKGTDVFCVLPTGFGKSLVFQLLVLVKSRASNNLSNAALFGLLTKIIIICLLKSK